MMTRKKTLLIVYYRLGMGGIEKRVRDIITDIATTYPQCKVHLILLDRHHSYFLDQLIANHVPFTYSVYPLWKKKFVSLGVVCWYMWKYASILPDAVLTFDTNLSYMVTVVSKLLFFWKKTNVFINASIVVSQYIDLSHEILSRYILTYIYNLADAIIVPTNAVRKDLILKYKIQQEKISIIPTWTLFEPLPQNISFRYDIAYIGRYEREKNPMGFLSIVAMLKKDIPNIHVLMIGEGSLSKTMKHFIKAHHLSAQITSLPFQKNVASLLRKTKILVVPSINEGLPNVVLEAGVCAVPAVVSSFAGADEAVKDGKTGFIAKTPETICEKILYLLRNESVRRSMGLSAQKRVLKYYGRATQKRYIAILLSR